MLDDDEVAGVLHYIGHTTFWRCLAKALARFPFEQLPDVQIWLSCGLCAAM